LKRISSLLKDALVKKGYASFKREDILYPGAFGQFQLPEGKVEENILSFERRVGKERLRLSFYQPYSANDDRR
jgi:hypothetical protein